MVDTQFVENPGPGPVPAQGTVTSVDIDGGTTGMSFTGGPVVGAGIITMTGEMAPDSGGTGLSLSDLAGKAWYTVRVNGTEDGFVVDPSPYPMAFTMPGVMEDNQLLLFNPSGLPFSLPANLAGSRITALSGATAEAVVTLYKNGVSFGTLTWAAAGTVPTISTTAQTFNGTTDVLTIYGPATADVTLGNIGFFMLGERTG